MGSTPIGGIFSIVQERGRQFNHLLKLVTTSMTKNRDATPWDIYVDEIKQGGYCLGFLEVPNTPSFEQKLFRCRQIKTGPKRGYVVRQEIHWTRLNRDVLPIAAQWVDCVFQHRGAQFRVLNWPKNSPKELVLLSYLAKFARRKSLAALPRNVVMFLDFDSDHAKMKIQNVIRDVGQITRCYHVDSGRNDCVQCCDLLLGAANRIRVDPTVAMGFRTLQERLDNGENLTQSECKRYLAGYLSSKLDNDESSVHDLR